MSPSHLLRHRRAYGLLAVCAALAMLPVRYALAEGDGCSNDCKDITVLVQVRGGGCYKYEEPTCFPYKSVVFVKGADEDASCTSSSDGPRMKSWRLQDNDCTPICTEQSRSEGTAVDGDKKFLSSDYLRQCEDAQP